MNKKDKHNNYGKLVAAAENGALRKRERERRGASDHDPNELKSTYHDAIRVAFKSRKCAKVKS